MCNKRLIWDNYSMKNRALLVINQITAVSLTKPKQQYPQAEKHWVYSLTLVHEQTLAWNYLCSSEFFLTVQECNAFIILQLLPSEKILKAVSPAADTVSAELLGTSTSANMKQGMKYWKRTCTLTLPFINKLTPEYLTGQFPVEKWLGNFSAPLMSKRLH